MLSVEWAICHDEQVAYRPLIIWRLIRKNLYSLNFLKDSGKRSARSWKTGAPAAGGYHIEYGYHVAFVGYSPDEAVPIHLGD